jgi:signal transduction histidine kinase
LQQSHSVLESLVNQRTAELRKLSLALLRSQDEEHRRIARELHDSFGQSLASLKINLDLLAGQEKDDGKQEMKLQTITECLDTVQLCIQETRTLSHLLQPPLLDEAGLFRQPAGT